MAVETVVSIVESATGGSFVSRVMAMSSAEWLAFVRQRAAAHFFKDLPRATAAWIARIQHRQRKER